MKTSFKNSFVHYIDKFDIMKKLLLLLLLSAVSCAQELTRGETINNMINEDQTILPYIMANGIVWTRVINEDNTAKVSIYSVSDEGLSLVENYLTKKQLIHDLEALPNKKGYEVSKEKKIINKWRYYFKDSLIKEIIINPEDWERDQESIELDDKDCNGDGVISFEENVNGCK